MNMPMLSHPIRDAWTLPLVREAGRRPMLKVAHEIGGLIDFVPHHRVADAERALLLQEAGVLIMGTSRFRPLGWDLAENISSRHGLDVLLLRFDAYRISFDICMKSRRSWLADYHRWSIDGELWFIPGEDDGSPYVKASRYGFLLLDHPPYATALQREAGIAPVCASFLKEARA